jgi:hypothetical protein
MGTLRGTGVGYLEWKYERLHKWRIGEGVGGSWAWSQRQKDQIPKFKTAFYQHFRSNEADFRHQAAGDNRTRHLISYLSQKGVFFRPCAPDSAQGNEACWIEDCPPPFSIRHEFKLLVGIVGVCS